MTGLLLAVALSASQQPAVQRLPFIEDDYVAALALAKKGKVPLFVDAWAPWCHTCVFMREHVFNQPELLKYGQRYVYLSLDTEKEKSAEFLKKYPVEVWPTLMIIDASTEQVALKWLGSLNTKQFGKLLDDGERAVKDQKGATPEALLAQADRLRAKGDYDAAVKGFRAALEKAPADWPRRARTTESLLDTLASKKDYADCAKTALSLSPRLPKGPSYVNAVNWGLGCASNASEKEPWRNDTLEQLYALGQDALTAPNVLADDRSGLYESMVEYLADKGDKKGSQALAEKWIVFLEGEAKAAKTPAARAVFDPHRVNAALAMNKPERTLPALLQSEKDLPDDYNPPAREALLYQAMGKYDDALAACERALTRVYGPRKLRVLETKASVLSKKGDAAGQKKTMQEALDYAKALPQGQRSDKTVARLTDAVAKLK
jgi:tetratricopeptide (TPR) repeat protein